jgi:lipoyl(octanoyl) transferase
MQAFTDARTPESPDELWFLEHPPVYTLGMNGSREHLLAPGDITVIDIDRGGQVTYHGPGQLVVYPLVDLERARMNVRQLVVALEQAIIRCVARYGIEAVSRCDAPGVYVEQRKLASLGLRIRRGCSYHGLALNVDMDLEPFSRINPCGFRGMEMTQLADLGVCRSLEEVAKDLETELVATLGYRDAASCSRSA